MKQLYLVLSAIFFTSIGFAQLPGVGIRGGINVAKYGGEVGSLESAVGINIGVDLNLPLGPSFSLQPEVAYSEMGAKGGGGMSQKLSYIAIPVLGKYEFVGSGFSLYAGPQIGILTGAKMKSAAGSINIKEVFNTTDVAAVLGLEFKIPVTSLFVSARYQFGLTDIDKDDAKLTNNGATLLLGWRFGGK